MDTCIGSITNHISREKHLTIIFCTNVRIYVGYIHKVKLQDHGVYAVPVLTDDGKLPSIGIILTASCENAYFLTGWLITVLPHF